MRGTRVKGNNGEGTKGHQEREKGRERDHRRRKWGGGGWARGPGSPHCFGGEA